MTTTDSRHGLAVGHSPGRVNLIGEHTDYNEGFVLPFALPHTATVRAAARPDEVVTVTSTQLGERVELSPDDLRPTKAWWGYVAGVVWVLRQRGLPVGGCDLSLDSRVPLGAGLSSSAALEAATVLALDDLFGLGLDADAQAQAAQAAENDFCGVPTGPMDQRASLWCEAGHALLLDCRTLRARQVPFDVAAHGLVVLLTDTRSPHVLADGHYAERREACADACRTLGVRALRDVTDLPAALAAIPDATVRRRVRHVVTENARVLEAVAALEASDWGRLGALMTASHASMRDDYDITVPTVDLAVDTALAAGALGSRMTGGGFGGSVISLCRVDEAERIAASITDAYAAAGFDAPGNETVVPSPGGRQLALTPQSS